MRTLVVVLALALFGAGTASAAPRHGHSKRHHHAVKHAKLKRHSNVKRA